MEFMTYSDPISRSERERRDIPRIGTLRVAGSFASSDCNFYPNHEVFGTSQGGDFPLYGEFSIDRDERGKPTGRVYLANAFASVPGLSHDGKGTYRYPFRLNGYQVREYVGGKEFRNTEFRIELDEPFRLTDGFPYVDGYDLDWLNAIVLDVADDGRLYAFDGDASRRAGILIFGHEFSLYLNKDLSFNSADSIDCGECSSYGTEEEFEASYPGVVARIRKARDQGVLRVYHYEWDGKRNNRSIVPFPG